MSSLSVSPKVPLCKILRVGSAFLIWSSSDVMKLREQRIVGALIGTMPKATRQNEQLALPLRLMLEEVVLLLSKGVADVVQYKSNMIAPKSDEYREAYEQWIQLEIDRQSLALHRSKLEGGLAHIHQIAYGRKAKIMGASSDPACAADGESKAKISKLASDQEGSVEPVTVTPEDVAKVEEEIRATPLRRLERTELLKEVWLDSPLFTNDEQFEPVATDIAPQTEIEKLRCAVFADLWEKGYCLTAGLKFGGDFLAYPGDPILYHASHIVICLPASVTYDSVDIAACARMGSQVKKIVLLCTWDKCDGSKISYRSLQWKRFEEDEN